MTLEDGPKVQQQGDCTGVMIPDSPDDFTGTPVHTHHLAYLIASSRVTVSTAPPSGTDPPP